MACRENLSLIRFYCSNDCRIVLPGLLIYLLAALLQLGHAVHVSRLFYRQCPALSNLVLVLSEVSFGRSSICLSFVVREWCMVCFVPDDVPLQHKLLRRIRIARGGHSRKVAFRLTQQVNCQIWTTQAAQALSGSISRWCLSSIDTPIVKACTYQKVKINYTKFPIQMFSF